MKNTIAWHEEVIKNQKYYLANKKLELASLQFNIQNIEANIRISEEQLSLAKKEGLSCYDRDKFNIKRKSSNDRDNQ